MDVLAYFEICELASSGEYVPVPVNHNEDKGVVGGVFMLQPAGSISENQSHSHLREWVRGALEESQ